MAPPRRPDREPVESRRAQRHQHKVAAKRRRLLIAGAVAFAVSVVAIVVVVATRDDDGEDEPKQLLILDEYSITGSLIVQPGDVTFVVANGGQEIHNAGVRGGPITADLAPGKAGRLELRGLQPGTYELYCDIIGHAERGMVATLEVIEPGSLPPPTPT